MFIKQLYSRYAYIAFRVNLHISVEAHLILKFYVYRTSCFQVEIIKKENVCSKQKAEFLMHICKHDVISDTPVVFRIKRREPFHVCIHAISC